MDPSLDGINCDAIVSACCFRLGQLINKSRYDLGGLAVRSEDDHRVTWLELVDGLLVYGAHRLVWVDLGLEHR